MNLKHIVLAAAIGAALGAVGQGLTTNQTHKSEMAKCNTEVTEKQKQINEFCTGQEIGPGRLATVLCNDKKELCFCGDPEMFNSAF